MSFERKMGRRLLSAAFASGVIAVSSVTGGCSLIMGDASATQCDVDTQCWENPNFSATDTNGRHQYSCQRGICAPAVGVISNPPPPSAACVSTQKCVEEHGGKEPWTCQRPGVDPCVKIESEDCTKIERKAPNGTVEFMTPGYAGALAEDSVLIGSITPLTYTPADKPGQRFPFVFMQDSLAAVDMAIAEWRTQAQGIAYGSSGGARPVFAVHCNSNYDVFGEIPQRAARHLIDVVKVKGLIVGADEELAAIAPMIAAAKIPTVCVECEKELPASVQGLAVRVKPSATAQAPLAIAWTKKLEQRVRTARPSTTNVKGLLVWQENGAPQIYGTLLASSLELNGKKATDNDAQHFKQIKIGDGISRTVDMHNIAQTQILPFTPDVVVLTGGIRTVTEAIYETEALWPAGQPRPEYLLDSVAANQATIDEILESAPDREDLRKRITGTKLAARSTNVSLFRTAFARPADDVWTGYEGFYALSYAMSAQATTAGFDGNFTGAGFAKLVDGASSPFHAAAIPGALSELRAGRTINVDGISTSLDWDLQTGEVKSAKFSVFCVSGQPFKLTDNAGVTYDAKTGEVSGTFACP